MIHALAPLALLLLPSIPPVQEADTPAAVVDEDLSKALSRAFEGADTPGAIAAIARFDAPIRIGAMGVRKAGSDAPMDTRDRVHVGSDTKAMTSVLAARLVDRGKIAWDTTVAEALPKLARKMDEAAREITLTHLLRHTSGLPAQAPSWQAHARQPLRERRRRIAIEVLGKAPETVPGEAYLYSNLGYMVAGAMLEACEDATWEELIQREVFAPLGITTAGFGPPSGPKDVEQPWGHRAGAQGPVPVHSDNDEALGPAGTVHIGLEDWGRFVLQFTDGAADASDFLSDASRARLLEVGHASYAYGWLVTDRTWAGGRALTHSGSNTLWFATAWVAPGKDTAFLVAANAADEATQRSVDRAVGALIQIAARDSSR